MSGNGLAPSGSAVVRTLRSWLSSLRSAAGASGPGAAADATGAAPVGAAPRSVAEIRAELRQVKKVIEDTRSALEALEAKHEALLAELRAANTVVEPPLPPVLPVTEEEVPEDRLEVTDAMRAEERALGLQLGMHPPDALDQLCDWVQEQLDSGGDEIAKALSFEPRAYVRQLLTCVGRSRIAVPGGGGFITPRECENLVCGGATQAGKTMFVVVGILAAYRARVPSVVITTTVRGSSSLFNKVKNKLELMQAGPQLVATLRLLSGARGTVDEKEYNRSIALGNSPDNPELMNRGALFIADTAAQIGAVHKRLKEMRRDRELAELRVRRDGGASSGADAQMRGYSGQFLLFLDEADSFQRTNSETCDPIKLERQLINLLGGRLHGPSGRYCQVDVDAKKEVLKTGDDRHFAAPQAVVSISATLLPVLMKANAEAKRESAATNMGTAVDADAPGMYPFFTRKDPRYVGVLSKLWKPFEAVDDTPAFLPVGALNAKNVGIDEGGLVKQLYSDAVQRPLSLLLDITVTRVNVPEISIRDKAEKMQELFPSLAVLVVSGDGATLYVPPTHESYEDNPTFKILRKECALEVGELLTLMEKGGEVPRAGQKNQVLCKLPRLTQHPFAVIGYSMMIRGDSFRSNYRVPTHMVNHLSNAMSIDRLVQSAGRATFQGAAFLVTNGFDCVRVLMLERDFKTVRAYVEFMDAIRDRLVTQKLPVDQCFDSTKYTYTAELHVLAGEHQKRCIGNRREGLFLDPTLFEGHEEREAAKLAAAEAEREARLAAAEAKKQAKLAGQKRKTPGSGGTDGSGQGKRARNMKDPVAWAATAKSALDSGAVTKLYNSRNDVKVVTLGTLRPESLDVTGTARLIPDGYHATCVVHGYTYDQKVQFNPATGRLTFSVQPAADGELLPACDTPSAAWAAALRATTSAARDPQRQLQAPLDSAAASDAPAQPRAAQRRQGRQGWVELGIEGDYGRALVETLLTPELRRSSAAFAAYKTVAEQRAARAAPAASDAGAAAGAAAAVEVADDDASEEDADAAGGGAGGGNLGPAASDDVIELDIDEEDAAGGGDVDFELSDDSDVILMG